MLSGTCEESAELLPAARQLKTAFSHSWTAALLRMVFASPLPRAGGSSGSDVRGGSAAGSARPLNCASTDTNALYGLETVHTAPPHFKRIVMLEEDDEELNDVLNGTSAETCASRKEPFREGVVVVDGVVLVDDAPLLLLPAALDDDDDDEEEDRRSVVVG